MNMKTESTKDFKVRLYQKKDKDYGEISFKTSLDNKNVVVAISKLDLNNIEINTDKVILNILPCNNGDLWTIKVEDN